MGLKALKTVFLLAFGPFESHFQRHNQSLISRKKPTKLQVIMSISREKNWRRDFNPGF